MADALPDAVTNPERLDALAETGLLDTAPEEAFDRFTRLASELLGADVALISLVDAGRQFSKSCVALVEPWASERELPLSHSFCKHVVDRGESVILEDAREEERLADSPAVTEAGIVAYAGVPLRTEGGHVLGSFCAIDDEPRSWSEEDVRLLEDLAAAVMARIELQQAKRTARQRSESLQAGQAKVLERVSTDAPLADVLDTLTRVIEEQAPDMIASVLLVDEETGRLRHGAAPHLPDAYNEAIDGLEPGPQAGSCGTVAHTGEQQIVADVQEDPRWTDFRALAAEHDLAACWSTPIHASDGSEVLGTFAMYHREPREPTEREFALIDVATDLARVAIERERNRRALEDAQRKAEARAEAAQRQRDRFFDLTIDLFSVINFDGTFASVNATWEDVMGFAPEELEGRSFTDLVHPDDREEVEAAFERAQSEDVYRSANRYRDADGDYHWLEWTAASVPEHDLMYGVARDVTERKEREAELEATKDEAQRAQAQAETAQAQAEEAQAQAEEAQAEAEAANAAKSRFVANMSHELRTPLNSIIGYSDMFRGGLSEWDEDRIADGLERIYDSGHRLLELINDVLDLSKAEAGRLALSLRTFPVADLVDQIADEVRPTMEENGNTFEIHLPDEASEICTDRSKARQILSNLLSNAAKYTSGGAVTLEVRLRTATAHNVPDEQKDMENEHCAPASQRRELVFEVTDTGIGMTDEEQQKIFDAFERAEDSSGSTGGTGLGLGIVQNLCSLLGGAVDVESEKGEGSRFTARFPVRALLLDETDGETDGAQPAAPGVSPHRDASTALPPRDDDLVLVIDDERDARVLMRNHLQEAGFEVETASSGPEGIEQAHELHPMAITLDVLMDEMDGWEVLTQLNGDPDLRHIPVVMVTITPDEGRGLQLGAAEHLVKPVERGRLVELLDQHRGDASHFSVLLIEHDADTRAVAQEVIDKTGATIHEAENAQDALDLLDEGIAPSLILLDLMMPGLNGFEFLDAAREQIEDIPIVVLTAKDLTEDDVQRLDGQVEQIIQKKGRTREALLQEVQQRVQAFHERAAADS